MVSATISKRSVFWNKSNPKYSNRDIYTRIATILNLKTKHNTNVPSYTYRVATVVVYSSNREEGAGGGEGCNPFLREGHPSPTTSEMYFNPLPHARRFMKREKWSYCTHTQRSLNVSHISVCVCVCELRSYCVFEELFYVRSVYFKEHRPVAAEENVWIHLLVRTGSSYIFYCRNLILFKGRSKWNPEGFLSTLLLLFYYSVFYLASF